MNFAKTFIMGTLATALTLSSLSSKAEGDLTTRPTKLPDLVLGTEDNRYQLSHKEYQLETGKAYKLKIVSSGQTEYAFQAPEFFASIFLRKLEAGDMEIKTMTVTELEFEQEAEAEIYFVPLQPGSFEFYAEGLEDKGMEGVFTIK
ncbi:MAG: putative cupredoxin-like copper-binding protein [Neptuniibacter pectenicola]|jgi:uncharacterized cupredoxin-like copper-binding protein|uniref:copper-binding protein n=1 Tax=Neptuniibacter pectenicola TaxID=1806669 RepID=UPI0030EEB39B|tara:strand:- start:12675 stop:13112 length:438 start_codon:yes stop_codon:yes gene_type:complete